MDNSALSTIYPFGLSDSSSTQCLWANFQLFVNDKYLTMSSVLPGSDLTDFFPLVGQTAMFPFATHLTIVSVQFSSVAQLCPTLCNPMNHTTPGLPVHHQLPEFTQTHAHRVGDAIQPAHPLSSPSPPAPNPYKHQGLFQWVNSSHEVAKVLEFQLQHQSFQWTPRTDLL